MAGIVLWNPTENKLYCMHGGAAYHFRPGEKKEIFDSYAAKHLLNRWGKDGLVELSYGEIEAKKFIDFDEYVHHQKIKGLEALLATLQKADLNNKIFDEECGQKKSVARTQYMKLAEGITSKVVALEKVITELKKMDVRKTPQQIAADLRRRAQELEEQASKLTKGAHKDGHYASKSA